MTDTPAHAEPTEDHPTRPLNFTRLDEAIMRERATSLYTCLDARRSVRFFSDAPVPLDVLRTAIHTAGTAPGPRDCVVVDLAVGICDCARIDAQAAGSAIGSHYLGARRYI